MKSSVGDPLALDFCDKRVRRVGSTAQGMNGMNEWLVLIVKIVGEPSTMNSTRESRVRGPVHGVVSVME